MGYAMSENKKDTKVEHVEWSNIYSTGIKLVDGQHKWLFNFVNALLNHSTGDEAEERIYFQRVIQRAVQYVQVHFETEEKYMIATNFSGYAEHKEAHDTFVQTIIKSVNGFKAGKKLVLENFASFLKDWLLSHVIKMDKQYSEYFKKIAVRKEDGTLSIKFADIQKEDILQ